jgi:hypothetical protein
MSAIDVLDPTSSARRAAFQTSAICLDAHEAALLGAFSAEVIQAAASCINMLSCFNAFSTSQNLRLPVSIATFAPVVPRSFLMVQLSGLARLLSPPTLASLKGFTDCLDQGRSEFDDLLQLTQTQTRVEKSDADRAIDLLNTASCFAKLALIDLASIHNRLQSPSDVAQMQYLAARLDEVMAGQCPLFVDGRFLPIRTKFNIREHRVALNAVASVIDPPGVDHVLVDNISQGGLGFKANVCFEPGWHMTVELIDAARVVSGRVAWIAGRRVGLAFFHRLVAGDPLLKVSAESR